MKPRTTTGTEFDLDAFLPRNRGSAENQALQAMIGTLVDGHD